VAAVLKPLWRDRHEVALKTLSKIRGVLDYAIAHEHRSQANPAIMRIMDKLLGPFVQPKAHDPSMPWADVPAFYATLEPRRDVPALALKWLIATATRSAEAWHATWAEIDREKELWTIPAGRMKTNEPHEVPLSWTALAVLDVCKSGIVSPYLFPGPDGKPISETSLRNILRKANLGKHDASLHGYRATFRTWCSDHDVDRVVAEQALAHRIGSKVEQVYDRSNLLKQRRAIMGRWGEFISPWDFG
jgi:integrase